MSIDIRPDQARASRHLSAGTWEASGVPSGLPHAFRGYARSTPNKTVVVDRLGHATYAEIEERAARAATALSKLGIGRGDAVLVQLPNWHEALVIHLAVEQLGGITVPMAPIYREREVRHIANLTEAKVAIVSSGTGFDLVAMYRALGPEMPTVRTLIVAPRDGKSDVPEGTTSYASLLEAERIDPSVVEAASLDPDRVTEFGFTNGSTGAPKAAIHTSNTLLAEHRVWTNAFELGASDVLLGATTVGHQIGFTMMRAAAWLNATIVFLDKWDPAAAIELATREGVTFTFTTPAFLYDVLASPKLEKDSLSKLRTWVLAGQVVTSALREEAAAKLPRVRFSPLFGMTEMGCAIMGDRKAPEHKLVLTGRPQPGVEIDVIDPASEESVPVDTDGELVLHCPGLCLGYYKQPDATAASFTKKGFFRTGDQVRRDADGYVMITGRIKDLIKRGGESISPEEVEEVLARHPKVAEVAVVGLPDSRLGERVCAFVVNAPGEPLAFPELVEYLKTSGLAKQKWPERLELVPSLPRTSIGKVHKATLRAALAGGAAPAAKASGPSGALGREVKADAMSADGFILRVEPAAAGMDLVRFCEANTARIRELLLAHGVMLFRGFGTDADGFARVASVLAPEPLDYRGGTSARKKFGADEGNVYLSTTFPPQYTLVQHYEMAYMRRWPRTLMFFCDTPSPVGGETPVASSRALMKRLDPKVVQMFAERRVMYEREMGKEFIRTWQEVFETTDKSAVEAYAKEQDITLEWLDGDRLKMRHVAQGTAKHPQTGELTWFNSSHFLHAELREIPNNGQSCFFGDGSPIDVAVLREVRAAFDETSVAFPWEKGDVMLIDNMLASHGRKPFSGPRRILAWLAESYEPGDR